MFKIYHHNLMVISQSKQSVGSHKTQWKLLPTSAYQLTQLDTASGSPKRRKDRIHCSAQSSRARPVSSMRLLLSSCQMSAHTWHLTSTALHAGTEMGLTRSQVLALKEPAF